MSDQTVARLRSIDRFTNLSDDEIQLIVSSGTAVNIPADWSLIWEKTPADKAYLILEGEVSVRKSGTEIARLGAGDTVGEAAIVSHKLRSASVVSTTPMKVLHFTSEAVRDLINRVPKFRDALEETTRQRLGNA